MNQTVRKMSTKDRILQTARKMFNERRYGKVTLAMLAEELKMAKGNLWYHFNDKRSLLEVLSEQFVELDGLRRQIRPVKGRVLDSYIEFLRALATEMREFRFLFRDQADYGEHSDIMLEQLPLIYDESQAQFSAFFRAMKQEKLLDIEGDRIEALALNATLVIRYNLDFARERGVLDTEGSGAVLQTFDQHLALFEDKMTDDAADYLRNTFSNKKTRDE